MAKTVGSLESAPTQIIVIFTVTLCRRYTENNTLLPPCGSSVLLHANSTVGVITFRCGQSPQLHPCLWHYDTDKSHKTLTASVRRSWCRSWPTLWLPQPPPCTAWQEWRAWWRAWPRILRSSPHPLPLHSPLLQWDGWWGAGRSARGWCRRRHRLLLHPLLQPRSLPWTSLSSPAPPGVAGWVLGLCSPAVGPFGTGKKFIKKFCYFQQINSNARQRRKSNKEKAWSEAKKEVNWIKTQQNGKNLNFREH